MSCELRAIALRATRRSSLAAFAVMTAAGCGDAEPVAGAWEFRVDTVASGTDGAASQTSWLRVVGQERHAGDSSGTPVILSFDCLRDQASSTVMTEQALRQGSGEARLILDTAPGRPIPAFAGTTPTGGQVVLTIAQDSLLALLSGHGRATIEYADGAGSSRTRAVFPLAGLEVHLGEFRAACRKR